MTVDIWECLKSLETSETSLVLITLNSKDNWFLPMALVLNCLIFFLWTEDSTVIFHQRDVGTPLFLRLKHICSLRACCLVETAGVVRLAMASLENLA